MFLIDTLKDTLNNVIYPKTRTDAIFDKNGNRLDNILSNMKGNIYSLEEVEIGSYLDSKLYRKVFNLGYNFTIVTDSETNINISIDNLSRIINASFIIENITTQLRASNPTMLYRNDTGTFLYKCYSRFNGSSTRNVKLVVEYTKTV